MNFKSFFTHFGLLLIFLVIFGVVLSLGFQPSTEMLILFIVGFSAQLIDGALGMGFGMISTASLLGFGMNPAIISSSVHAAEIFSSAASGISHHRNGNVNKKLFLSLLIPGMIGAIVGASLLVIASDFNLELLAPQSSSQQVTCRTNHAGQYVYQFHTLHLPEMSLAQETLSH